MTQDRLYTDVTGPPAPPPTVQDLKLREYFEDSVREVLPLIYPKRYEYTATSEGSLWEIEYQAWVYASQFAETLPDAMEIDDDELIHKLKTMFANSLIAGVKAKMERKDIR